jgi:cation diffusion facilitator CzcD-associated flavoprotein CzcO
VREGRASVVTGAIERFEQGGIRLASGELVEADVIVTATGLALTLGGKIAISLDGMPVRWNELSYRDAPHLAIVRCLWYNLSQNTPLFTRGGATAE